MFLTWLNITFPQSVYNVQARLVSYGYKIKFFLWYPLLYLSYNILYYITTIHMYYYECLLGLNAMIGTVGLQFLSTACSSAPPYSIDVWRDASTFVQAKLD